MNLAHFLLNRIFLIDTTKRNSTIIFILEDHYKNCEVILDLHSIKCSCEHYTTKNYVCNHIKFVLQNIDKTTKKRSKSYNSLGTVNKLFNVDMGKDLDINQFRTDLNPRYKEYTLLQDFDRRGSCYICLDKLSGKIIRCKQCSRYYHEKCIYGWLRYSPACTCPNCRGQWL